MSKICTKCKILKPESDLPKYGAGLDRIDSTKGYSLNNVVCCCHKCNIMKLKMTTLDFSKHILKLIPFANNYIKDYRN
jgi:hypothetical protein